MNNTTPAEELDLTELAIAVRSFWNLFFHRTALLEGIRQIAGRNMVHLADAAARSNDDSLPEEKPCDMLAVMLSDQGLEDDAANRFIVEIATYCPFQIYLALLYAELDCVREWQGQSKILENDGLLRYLEENDGTIDRLRRFRNSFLHPKPATWQIQAEFLDHEQWYQKVPELQGVVDQYLLWVNGKLFGMVKEIVNRLPKLERFAYIKAALKLSSNRMILHDDPEGLERVQTQEKALEEQIAGMAEEELAEFVEESPLMPRQAEVLGELAGYMGVVLPSRKEYQFSFAARRQPPIDLRYLILFGRGGLERYGDSRAARQTVTRITLIRWLVAASAVMLSESTAWEEERTREHPLSKEKVIAAFEKSRGKGLTPLNRALAPSRLSLALLYEPLRYYREMEQQDPSVHDGMLSSITGDKLVTLREFRKSVFHVPDHTRDSFELYTAAAESFRYGSGPLHMALAEFFGPQDPT